MIVADAVCSHQWCLRVQPALKLVDRAHVACRDRSLGSLDRPLEDPVLRLVRVLLTRNASHLHDLGDGIELRVACAPDVVRRVARVATAGRVDELRDVPLGFWHVIAADGDIDAEPLGPRRIDFDA